MLTCLAALLFGLGPAWAASRRDLTSTMNAASASVASHGTRGFSVRNLLVVGEMAIALVLLTAGGLMVKSVARLQATELGFVPESVLTVRLVLPAPQYDRARGSQFIVDLIDRLASRPDIGSVAFGSCAPLSGGCNRTLATLPGGPTRHTGARRRSACSGRRLPTSTRWGSGCGAAASSPGSDRAGQPKVVVVNETAARTYWPGEDPLGKRIALGQGGFQDGAEVIGMVADVRYGAVENSVGPDVYLPLLQAPRALGRAVRAHRRPAGAIVPPIRAAVEALDPNLPLIDIKTMEMRFGEATWRQRSSAWLLGIFALLALALAATGIYAVMSQGVEQRRARDRRAPGARRGAPRHPAADHRTGRGDRRRRHRHRAGGRRADDAAARRAALQVTPGDPSVFAVLALVVLGVTLLAGYIPARRATRVDPMITLRAE